MAGNFELVTNPGFKVDRGPLLVATPVKDTTAYAAMSVFQDTILSENRQPGELTAALDYYTEVMRREGDETVRKAAAQMELYDRQQAVINTVGRVDPGAAADAIIGMPLRDTYLEERAIDNNWNNSIANEESLTPLEQVDTIADYQKKIEIVSREFEQRMKQYGDASTWTQVGDVLGQMLFWNNINARTGLVDLEEERNVFNPLVAKRISDEVFELMINTPIDEFPAKFQEYLERSEDQSAIFGTNQAIVLRNLERLMQFTVPSAVSISNFESGIDFLDAAGIGLGAGVSATRMARMTGNLNNAARLGQNNPHHNLFGAQQVGTGSNQTIAANIQNLQENFQKSIIDELDNITKYRSTDELNSVLNNTRATMDAFYPNRVVDIRWKKHAATGDPNWSEFTDVYIGKQGGEGFVNEQWATNQAKAMGLQNYDVVQDINTRKWLIHTEHRPTETRAVLGNDLSDTSDSWIARYTKGARQLIDERSFEASSRAEMTVGNLANYFAPFAHNLSRLSKREKSDLNVIATKGLNHGDGKWYTESELYNEYQNAFTRDPTPREVQAYYSYKALSDMEWAVRNRSLRSSLAFDNWREIEISGSKGLARRVETVPNRADVYDINGNAVTHNPGDFIVEIADTLPNPSGQGFPMKFIKLDNPTQLRELPSDVLGYAEGGRRYYDADYFLKQDRSVVSTDGVRVYNPSVLTAAKTRKEALEIANALNRISADYIEWQAGTISRAMFEARLARFPQLHSLDSAEIHRLVADGKWDPNKPFEALSDGQLPTETARNLASPSAINYTSSISDVLLYSDRLGRMYYSPRGQPLQALDTSNPLPTVNVYEAASRSMSNAIKTGAWNNYRIEAVNSWVKTATDSNAFGNPEIMGKDPWSMLKEAELIGPDAGKLQTLREHILWNLDPSTPDSRFFDSVRLRIREWLHDKDKPFRKYPGLTSRVEALVDVDPVSSLRALTFDRHLGFFGIDQLVAQAGTWMTSSAMHGTKAVTSAMPYTLALRAIHMKQGWIPPRDLANFVAHSARMFPGTNKAELTRRLRALNRTGVMNVGGEMAQLQMSSEYVHSSRVYGAIEKTRRAGRVFFNWAEQNNRLTAFNIAYDKVLARGLDPLSDVGIREISKMTQDYSFNMTKSQTAWWQRGLPSVFTQFYGYIGRYIDAMMGKQFSRAERAKMVAVHSILWGTAGVPVLSNIMEHYGVDEHTAKGAFDNVLSWAIGTETDAAKRLDPIYGVKDMLKDIYLDGPSAVFQIPAIDTLGQAGGAVGRLWNLRYAGEHSQGYTILASETRDIVTEFVTPWNRAMRAYYIYATGKQVSRLGNKVVEDNDLATSEALAALLGVQRDEVSDIYNTLWDMRARREKLVLPIAEQYAKAYNKGFTALEQGDEEAYNRAKIELEILMQPLNEDPELKAEVLSEVTSIIRRNALSLRTDRARQREGIE